MAGRLLACKGQQPQRGRSQACLIQATLSRRWTVLPGECTDHTETGERPAFHLSNRQPKEQVSVAFKGGAADVFLSTPFCRPPGKYECLPQNRWVVSCVLILRMMIWQTEQKIFLPSPTQASSFLFLTHRPASAQTLDRYQRIPLQSQELIPP